MKRRPNTERRPRPKLPRIPEEMRQWSDLLLREILAWHNVSSRPMFGMTAVYRGNAIFGVLPRTRATDNPYSVSFKILLRNPSLKKRLLLLNVRRSLDVVLGLCIGHRIVVRCVILDQGPALVIWFDSFLPVLVKNGPELGGLVGGQIHSLCGNLLPLSA